MKKIFSIILAVAMLATMSVTAFAAENAGGNTSINVKGNYVPAQDAGEKISVDLIWDAMEFTYTEGAAGEWLPGEHKYADNAAGSWSTDTATITVTNHSNVAVTATLSFVSNVDGVIGTFDKNTLDLASAEGTVVAEAPQADAEFGISGAAITKTEDTLGTITVAIAANAGSSGDDEGDEGDVIVATTAQQLTEALEAGGNIKLGGNITLEETVRINNLVNLDLNSNTLTVQECRLVLNSELSVRNGTIQSNSDRAIECSYYSILTVDNCTISSPDYYALYMTGATAVVTNSTINGGVAVTIGETASTLTAVDNVTITNIAGKYTSGLSVNTGCTATVGFDPTGILSAYNEGTPTNNGDGTWTVK